MADEFSVFPLKYEIASKGPSPHEAKFPEPGSPNRGPGYLGRTMSLEDYKCSETHAPRYADILSKDVRK